MLSNRLNYLTNLSTQETCYHPVKYRNRGLHIEGYIFHQTPKRL